MSEKAREAAQREAAEFARLNMLTAGDSGCRLSEIIDDILDAYLAARRAEGFVEVPVEPTEAMTTAGENALFAAERATAKWLEEWKARTGGTPSYVTDHAAQAYRAMLKAAPDTSEVK